MTYDEFNLFMTFLWNRVDRKKFAELLEEAIGRKPDNGYIDEKWEQFQRCPGHFVQGYKQFFKAAMSSMKAINYKG
jgi:hypothetical protein